MININCTIEYWQLICSAVCLLLVIALWKFNKLLAIKIRIKRFIIRSRIQARARWIKINNWLAKKKRAVRIKYRYLKRRLKKIKGKFTASKFKWLYIGLVVFFIVNEIISIFYELDIIR